MKKHVLMAILMMAATACLTGFSSAETANLPNPAAAFSPKAPDFPAFPENDFLCADVNEDGFINVLDIITLVNYIMGGSPGPFNMEAADINADDTINILDVISLVNIIMQAPGIPCGCVAPVVYEGKTYATVQIGEQCWLKENLNAGTMISSNAGGQLQTNNGSVEKYCYDNDEANCTIYGGLYEWKEAMQYVTTEGAQGICPGGWHIPSNDDWTQLTGFLGGLTVAGGKMKSTGTFDDGTGLWNAPNIGATNESGFTALPAGERIGGTGFFSFLHGYTYLWSSTEEFGNTSWYRYLMSHTGEVGQNPNQQEFGMSVRCLKGGCTPQPTPADAGPDQLNVPGTAATLTGNTPADGTGLWEIVSGTGGAIVSPDNPASQFQGQAGNEYTLSWTITTACGGSTDQVVISFASTGGFACGDLLLDERDGQSYATVLISYMCWMAENLNVGTMVSGTIEQSNNGTLEKYCYENEAANCDTYGALYQWNEAMQYVTSQGAQGICPQGWHIPSNGEFTLLMTILGGEDIAGGKMKSTGTLEEGTGLWREPNVGATNSSGFTGLPHGYRETGGEFYSQGYYGDYWTSTQKDEDNAWYLALYNDDAAVDRYDYYKEGGSAIRCLRDCSPYPTEANAGADQNGLPGTFTTLAGNTPSEGSGLWQIISGAGGTVSNATSPTSGFQGQPCTVYTLSWTINNVCGSSSDMVTISFAPEGTFTCGDLLEDCRDGKFYQTVQIGEQCWMAENLNTGSMIISDNEGQQQTDNQVIEKYCPNNDPANCETYGGLYEWHEAMQYVTTEGSQGICPIGWHLPTHDESVELTDYLGGVDVAGGKMKATGTIEEGTGLWYAPNTDATNLSGFTSLPSGYRDHYDGSFVDMGYYCDNWTSTKYDDETAWYWCLYYNWGGVDHYTWYKEGGSGIRCIRDCTPQPTQANAGNDQILTGSTSTTLQGNTPIFGTGLWEIVEGTGGVITDPSNPASTFQGQSEGTYLLSWTISTACGSSTDQVIIYFSACQTDMYDYTFEDLTDPYAYSEDSWADIGWADITVPSGENVNVGCVIVTASQICSDDWPDEVTLYLKSPAGTILQIWQGFADFGCTTDFHFTTNAFDGEPSQGQWILYFEDYYGDGGGTCVGAKLYIGN